MRDRHFAAHITASFLGALCLLALSQNAWGLAPYKEDLAGCQLPHGEVLIPFAGAAAAAKGDLLKLSDGTLAVLPGARGDKPVNRAAAASDLRGKDAGDVEFMPDDKAAASGGPQGAFWAVSGRIVDVGARYLYEAAAMKLDRPAAILGDASRPAGYLPAVREGNTYLLETANGRFALLRVLEISTAGVRLQYVYEPTGQIQFDVPRGTLAEQTASPATAPAAATENSGRVIGATGTPGTIVIDVGDDLPGASEPSLQTFLAQRKRMIASRMKILNAPAKTPAEIQKKVAAINDLAALDATEACESLVNQITFLNPNDAGSGSFKDSVHPCFVALKKLGGPARDTALKALRQLDLKPGTAGGEGPATMGAGGVGGGRGGGGEGDGEDILQSPGYRATLLGLVIRAVEGDTAGEFLLRQERDAAPPGPRRALYDALISPQK